MALARFVEAHSAEREFAPAMPENFVHEGRICNRPSRREILDRCKDQEARILAL
jgi:hypothetical protein